MSYTLGLISDTHGLLRPEAMVALRDCDRIFHLGDVGKLGILEELKTIAPLTAVRGNVDRPTEKWAHLPRTEFVQFGGYEFYLIHILDELDLDPAAAGFDFVLFGHSHKPASYRKEGVWYINPGSAGPRRFSLPIALAILTWEAGETPALRQLELAI